MKSKFSVTVNSQDEEVEVLIGDYEIKINGKGQIEVFDALEEEYKFEGYIGELEQQQKKLSLPDLASYFGLPSRGGLK